MQIFLFGQFSTHKSPTTELLNPGACAQRLDVSNYIYGYMNETLSFARRQEQSAHVKMWFCPPSKNHRGTLPCLWSNMAKTTRLGGALLHLDPLTVTQESAQRKFLGCFPQKRSDSVWERRRATSDLKPLGLFFFSLSSQLEPHLKVLHPNSLISQH